MEIQRHTLSVLDFQSLVSTILEGELNAVCWERELGGDFGEIVSKFHFSEAIKVIELEELEALDLTPTGRKAREIIVNDLKLLTDYGAEPVLNLINYYERDESGTFLPTDVYSYHVDYSPVATDTFLCTYFGDTSEIIPNSKATKKVLIPEIREKLWRLYDGPQDGFEDFLRENFFDLHYEIHPDAQPLSLGLGQMWRLATENPESKSMPCVHRAPLEKSGLPRLLLIC